MRGWPEEWKVGGMGLVRLCRALRWVSGQRKQVLMQKAVNSATSGAGKPVGGSQHHARIYLSARSQLQLANNGKMCKPSFIFSQHT